MNIGKRFKRYRQSKHLTQKEAAEALGINSYQLANYESNRSEPSIATLKGMSKLYQVSIDNLLGNDASNDLEIPNDNGTNDSSFDDFKNKIQKLLDEFNNRKE